MDYVLAFVLALLAGVAVIELLDWAMPTGADKRQRRIPCGRALHRLHVVVAMNGEPALIALVAIALIASLEFYD